MHNIIAIYNLVFYNILIYCVTSVYFVHEQHETGVGLHGSTGGIGRDEPRIVSRPGRDYKKSECEKSLQNHPVRLHDGE